MNKALFPCAHKAAAFGLTYWSYVALKAANKSFSLVKTSLIVNRFFTSDLYDTSQATEMCGLITTLFLAFYAVGQFTSGSVADRVDLRHFITFSMAISGLFTLLFGLFGYLNVRDLSVYAILWSMNGLVLSIGWPANLAIMGNWFSKASRGSVISIWSSNSNMGHVFGACLCTVVYMFYAERVAWKVTMMIVGGIAVIGALPIFFSLVPKPPVESLTVVTEVREEVENVLHDGVPSPSSTELDATSCNDQYETVEDLEEESGNDDIEMMSRSAVRSDAYTATSKQDDCEPLTSASSHNYHVIEALSLPHVTQYALANSCLKGASYVYLYWLPFFLISDKGLSYTTASLVSMMYDIGMFTGGIVGGYLSDRMGKRSPVILSMICGSVVLPFVLLSPISDPVVLSLLLLLVGVVSGGPQILISGCVAVDLADSSRGNRSLAATVSGIIDGSGSGGAALLQYIVGMMLLCDTSEEDVQCSWGNVFVVLASVNIIAFGSLIRIGVKEFRGVASTSQKIIEN